MSRKLTNKEASKVLEANNFDAYQEVFESFGLGTLLLDRSGQICAASKQIALDLGYEHQQLLKKRIFEINPHISLVDWKKRWKLLQQTGYFELDTEYMTVQEMLYPVRLKSLLIEYDGKSFCLMSVKNQLQANRYKKLLELTAQVSKVGGWEWDLVNDAISMTEEVASLLNMPGKPANREELERHLEKRLAPEAYRAFNLHLRSAIESGEPESFEVHVQQPGGDFSNLAITVVPEKSELQTIKLYGTLQDISGFSPQDEDLKLAQFTLDHAKEMIFWETADGRFLYSNMAVQEHLGYSRRDILNMKACDIVHNYSDEERHSAWEELSASRHMDREMGLRAKDGSVIPVYCSFSLIRFKDQEINCIFARDWRRKKARDERLLLSQFTMDNAVDMIFWFTPEGEVRYVNETAYHQLEYTAFETWDKLFPNDPEAKTKAIWEKLEKERRFSFETRISGADGEEIPVEAFINYISYEGHAYGCAFVRDISARIRKSVELATALDKVQELTRRLQKENTLLKEEINLNYNFKNIISESPRYKKVLHQIEQVSETDATVLIIGETGTGKELLARSLHLLSRRSDAPMIKVNCAALPKELIESELFGHEKGAFTGAFQQKKGRFEMADGGTIFLDEIGELPLDLQTKFLRVLQEGEFERVGGSLTLKTNVRVVAATNRNLVDMVNEGEFREDLYYRLNVFPVYNIPLRERREDIPLLVRYFVKKYAEKAGKKIEDIPQEPLDELLRYAFPGNIRELENIVERAVILSAGSTLNLADAFHKNAGRPGEGQEAGFKSFEAMQRDYIIQALSRCNWRISGPKGAAKMLQLNPRTLASKMRRLDIHRKDFID